MALPGGPIATRPLHFISILDCSGSMNEDGRIQATNTAIREALPSMLQVSEDNPHAEMLVRAIKFSSGAQWHISQPTPVKDFKWIDLAADGVTDMGKAFSMVADQLKIPPMTDRALPPVLVLVTDGQPTDDYKTGLKQLLDQPWGKKAVRIAIAIGADLDNINVLKEFINNPEIKPCHAEHADQITKYIKWASTVVVKSASAPPSRAKDSQNSNLNVHIPAPPSDTDGPNSAGDVW